MEYFKSHESVNESDSITVYFDGETVYFNSESVNKDSDNCRVIINDGETVSATNENTLADDKSACVRARNVNISVDGESNLNNNIELPYMYTNQSKVSFVSF